MKTKDLFSCVVKKQGIVGVALFFARPSPQMKNVYRRDSGLLMNEMFYSRQIQSRFFLFSLFSLLEVTATATKKAPSDGFLCV